MKLVHNVTGSFASVALVVAFTGCGEVKSDASAGDDPKITAIAPARGPADGGILVTLTGTGLATPDPIVIVDGVRAKDATATSDTELTFMLPPGLEGHTVDISVATDHGFGVSAGAFTYNLRPVVLGISPVGGRAAGGTNVTITGRGFQDLGAGIPTVIIGGTPATNVQIVDDHTIKATNAPALPATPAFVQTDISVQNTNGVAKSEKVFTLTKAGLLATYRNAVYWIDPSTKATIQIAALPRVVGGCALSPTGKLFGRSNNPTGNFKELVTFDPLANTVTSVGDLMDGVSNRAIASMTFVGNTLIGTDSGQNGGTQTHRLYSIDVTTGALTAIGAANPVLSRHSSIAAKDGGSVYQLQNTATTLNTVTTTTGATTAGPPVTGGNAVATHAMTMIGSTLYVAEDGAPTVIYTMDPATGVLTQLTQLQSRISSFCQTPPSF